ncbi:MAG: hypothetical protein LAT75_15500, partial [Candidatus Cyclonatronum sp.]|uniref:hypothetical protein n=1 Tax=Cyclonatronum sp. TaxID=3024185 RepID=UPI0025B9AF99
MMVLLAFGTELLAQNSAPERSVRDFLDEHGNFHIPEGYQGSLDVAGFDFAKGDDGAPVFRPAGTGHPDNQFWTQPESYLWGANGNGFSMLIHGDNLHIGGRFDQ